MTSAQTNERTTLRVVAPIAGFYFASFAVLAVWLPFAVDYLHARGLSAREGTLVVAAGIWIRTFSLPWMASFADRHGIGARALALASAASLATFALLAAVDGIGPLLLAGLLFGMAYPPLIPWCDRVAVRTARERGIEYGRLRLFGSVSFLLTMIGVGAWIDRSSPEVVPIPILIALLCATILSLWMDDPTRNRGSVRDRPVRGLLRDRGVRRILVTAGLIQASHAAYYALSVIDWQKASIDRTTSSILWSEGVLAEVLLFAGVVPALLRSSPKTLFLLGAGSAVLRWAVLATTTDIVWLASTSWLHALSFGATHVAAVRALSEATPSARSATAQSLLSAMTNGGFMALSTALAAELYEPSDWSPLAEFSGRSATYPAMALLALLGGLSAIRLTTTKPSTT
ncbi:MAG: MFS transporter [Planctomycetota bacterium]